jgi:hypothetical protein
MSKINKIPFKQLKHLADHIWNDTEYGRGREVIEFLLREVYFKDHSDGVKVEEVDGKIVITPRIDYMRDAFEDFDEYLNDNKEFNYNWEDN